MIYIQSDNERKLPHHFDAACALYGAIESGLDYRLTSTEEINSGKFDMLLRKHTAVGSADFMSLVFQRINRKPVLPAPFDRPFEMITLEKAIHAAETGLIKFIKPVEHKLFSGMILTKNNLAAIQRFPLETAIISCEPFNSKIISEWRLYISDGKIVDSRNYSGDFTVSPDYETANRKLKVLDNFPVSFVMDIGILENQTNVVVEFNDMWAIGNYGLENSVYLNLLMKRYTEIVNN